MARASYLEQNSGVSKLKLKVENVTAARTLTANDSGKIFTLDQDASFDITLPAAADAGAGWHAKFILTDAGSGSDDTTSNIDKIISRFFIVFLKRKKTKR